VSDGKEVRSVGVWVEDEQAERRFGGFARIALDFWLRREEVDVWEEERRWMAGGVVIGVTAAADGGDTDSAMLLLVPLEGFLTREKHTWLMVSTYLADELAEMFVRR
jgi:hypothetical protein